MPQVQRAAVAALSLILSLAVLAAPSQAFRLGTRSGETLASPADALKQLAVDDSTYDPATHCTKARRPGVEKMLRWLGRNAGGVSWGTYRCELWGKGSASLHAEGRAIDWHLDSRIPSQRAAGTKLIRMLLATDGAGNPQALARRMGVEELIWDCSYWSAGSDDFRPYSACYGKDRTTRRKHVNPTIGHMDHIHIGMSKAGAMAKTSFWTRKAPTTTGRGGNGPRKPGGRKRPTLNPGGLFGDDPSTDEDTDDPVLDDPTAGNEIWGGVTSDDPTDDAQTDDDPDSAGDGPGGYGSR